MEGPPEPIRADIGVNEGGDVLPIATESAPSDPINDDSRTIRGSPRHVLVAALTEAVTAARAHCSGGKPYALRASQGAAPRAGRGGLTGSLSEPRTGPGWMLLRGPRWRAGGVSPETGNPAIGIMGSVNSTPTPASRAAAALATAKQLVNAMELEDAPIDRCLMLAQRLARLMRDADAQRWLDYEQRGYPETLPPNHLGSCGKYAFRFSGKGKIVARASLPALEATKRANELVLEKTNPPSVTGVAENFTVAGATKTVITAINATVMQARDNAVNANASYSRLRAMLHRWAADTLISLELGSAAEGIFDGARRQVDAFVRTYAPSAAEQLVAVNERMNEGTDESFSQALTSCRRLLATVADAVFPPHSEPIVDRKGRSRQVGPEQYKNRLLAFLDERIGTSGTSAIVTSQLEHLAARLDAVYEKACKGVHADVDNAEAQLVVIQTYLFLAEVARYATPEGGPLPSVGSEPKPEEPEAEEISSGAVTTQR